MRQTIDRFLKKLDGLTHGELELITPDGQVKTFGGKLDGPKAKLQLHDWRVLPRLAWQGDIGFVEDYKQGLWETPNLQDLIAVAFKNDQIIKKYLFGNPLAQLTEKLSYILTQNTLKGSKRNIQAHYDLGNAFYKLWLDPSMTYSSALFKSDNELLQAAQNNKYDRLIERMDTNSGSILEIGCGWGGFAERALEHGDYDLRALTLSQEQHDYARERLAGKQAHVALQDYRHQSGSFDNVVSIEMFEAVGEKYWPTYFNKVASLLKKRGKALIQTITIDDGRFDNYRARGDVIRSYIFPGGMLPSPSRFKQEAGKAGLKQTDAHFFGQDYAKTLEIWLHNFDTQRENIKALGFDDSFIRLWRFYLAGCIAGFSTGRINVMQTELQHA